MPSQKLIVILGATGNQGGSVANSFLDDPEWRVRALTRNTSSSKAEALKSRGAEVVQADMDDPSSLDSAFHNAYAIFAVSDFWGIYNDPANADKPKVGQLLNQWTAEYETQQLKNVIEAASKVSSLERFVVSSLSNATKWSGGKYSHVYHFDAKANAVEYGKTNFPALWEKTSVFQAGFFLSNFVGNQLLTPTLGDDGIVKLTTNLENDIHLPWIAAEEDSGPLVKALVLEEPGKNLIGYREWITMDDFAKAFTEATGRRSEAVMLPKGQFAVQLPSDLAMEMEDNYAYWNEFGYEGKPDPSVIHPKDLQDPPELETVYAYLKKQDWTKILGC